MRIVHVLEPMVQDGRFPPHKRVRFVGKRCVPRLLHQGQADGIERQRCRAVESTGRRTSRLRCRTRRPSGRSSAPSRTCNSHGWRGDEKLLQAPNRKVLERRIEQQGAGSGSTLVQLNRWTSKVAEQFDLTSRPQLPLPSQMVGWGQLQEYTSHLKCLLQRTYLLPATGAITASTRTRKPCC